MADLHGLVKDPDFINLPLADQRQILVRATGDQDFAALSDLDLTKFLNVARNAEPTQLERENQSEVGQQKTQRAVAKAGNKPYTSPGEPTVEGRFVPKGSTAKALPYAAANNMVYPGVGTAAQAVPDVAEGNYARAGHDLLSGALEAGSTALPAAIEAAPIQTARALAGGSVAQDLATRGAGYIGANPDQAALAGDIAAIGGGALATGRLPRASVAEGSPEILPAEERVPAGQQTPALPGLVADSQKLLNRGPIITPPPSEAPPASSQLALPPAPREALPLVGQDPAAVAAAIGRVQQKAGVQPTIGQLMQPETATQAAPSSPIGPQFATNKLRLADLMDDKAVIEAMRNDLYRQAVLGGREQRAEAEANAQSMGIGLPKWERQARVQAQSIMDEAQQRAEQVMEQARQQGERGIFAKVPQESSGAAPAIEPDELTARLKATVDAVRDTDLMKQAREKLGPDASLSQVAQEAAKMRIAQAKSGAQNTIVDEDAYQQARQNFSKKVTSSNLGLDPTAAVDLAKIGAYHLERGARTFLAWSKAVMQDAGPQVKPYLDELYRNLQASTAKLRENPLPAGQKPTVADLMGGFDKYRKQQGLRPISNPEKAYSRGVAAGAHEIGYQLQQPNSGVDWYSKDIERYQKAVEQEHPELKNPTQRVLFKAMQAGTSLGNKSDAAVTNALDVYNLYKSSGKVPLTNPETGAGWPNGQYNAYQNTFRTLQSLIDAKGEDGAAQWLMEKHPISEIRQFNKNVAGKMADQEYGALALGPKAGPFFLNMSGVPTKLTADVWFTRTWNRWMGTPFDAKGEPVEAPRNETERAAMLKVVEDLAKAHGIDTRDAQAVLWNYEQQLYTKHGIPSEQPSYGESAERVVAKRLGSGEPASAGTTREGRQTADSGRGPRGNAQAAKGSAGKVTPSDLAARSQRALRAASRP